MLSLRVRQVNYNPRGTTGGVNVQIITHSCGKLQPEVVIDSCSLLILSVLTRSTR